MYFKKEIDSQGESPYEEDIWSNFGEAMLQENSFFSTPFIFFGPTHNDDDEELENEDEEINFSETWSISFQTDFSHMQQQRIGLFIHWFDLNE